MNLKINFLAALTFFALAVTSCNNKEQLQQMQDKYDSQIDSLEMVIDSLSRESIEKDGIIASQDTMIVTYLDKLKQYKDVIGEYKTVLYAIVGEDGLYHYGDIDYD